MLCSANSALVPARILKRNALKMLKQILPEQVCLQVFSLRKQGGPENPKDKSVCTLITPDKQSIKGARCLSDSCFNVFWVHGSVGNCQGTKVCHTLTGGGKEVQSDGPCSASYVSSLAF